MEKPHVPQGEPNEPPRDGEYFFDYASATEARVASGIERLAKRVFDAINACRVLIRRKPMESMAIGVGAGVLGTSLLFGFPVG